MTTLKGVGLTALSKALLVCSIANSACVYFEHQSLVATGQAEVLLSKASYNLFDIGNNEALKNVLDNKLERAKELIA